MSRDRQHQLCDINIEQVCVTFEVMFQTVLKLLLCLHSFITFLQIHNSWERLDHHTQAMRIDSFEILILLCSSFFSSKTFYHSTNSMNFRMILSHKNLLSNHNNWKCLVMNVPWWSQILFFFCVSSIFCCQSNNVNWNFIILH